MKKSTLFGAIAAATMAAAVPTTASAALVNGVAADSGVGSCLLGGTYPDNCTYGITNVASGSWFAMDNDASGDVAPGEKVPQQMLNNIDFNDLTPATGSHAGDINGTESPVFDIWEFFGGTGMDYLTSAMVDNGDGTVDMTGWSVAWNGIALIPMGGDPANFAGDTGLGAFVCSGGAACAVGDTFTLDYNAHVPLGDASGFGGVGYFLHLEGTVSSVVPVPAAVWLFGSGLLGLVGIARRKSRA